MATYPVSIEEPPLTSNVQALASSLNCYALDARHSNANPQDFTTTYKKAKQLLLQSGK